MKIRKLCEITIHGLSCGKKSKFKIIDIECGELDGDYKPIFVCEDCVKFFIEENENPHYILIGEVKK